MDFRLIARGHVSKLMTASQSLFSSNEAVTLRIEAEIFAYDELNTSE